MILISSSLILHKKSILSPSKVHSIVTIVMLQFDNRILLKYGFPKKLNIDAIKEPS
jgi:hypothetical protein